MTTQYSNPRHSPRIWLADLKCTVSEPSMTQPISLHFHNNCYYTNSDQLLSSWQIKQSKTNNTVSRPLYVPIEVEVSSRDTGDLVTYLVRFSSERDDFRRWQFYQLVIISFALLHQMNYASVTQSGWSPFCVSSLCVAVPSLPEGETEARECLRKLDTNRVPWRHSNLCKIMSLDNNFCEVKRVRKISNK